MGDTLCEAGGDLVERSYALGSLSAKDYYDAQRLLQGHLASRAMRGFTLAPAPLRDGRFWFARATRDGVSFVVVDPERGAQSDAFDHTRLAEALSSSLGVDVAANALPITQLDFLDAGFARIHVGASRFKLNLETYALELEPFGGVRPEDSVSPDGKWAVFALHHNLYLRDLEDGAVYQITVDGTYERSYGAIPDPLAWSHEWLAVGIAPPPAIVWSPDSSRFATHILDQTGVGELAWITSSSIEGGRPIVRAKRYSLPGDANIPRSDVVIFDVSTRECLRTDAIEIATPYLPLEMTRRLFFAVDGRSLFLSDVDRFARKITFSTIDCSTGRVRVLLREEGKTHLQLHPSMMGNNCVVDGDTLVWWSQRSGWGHLYRYDLRTSEFRNAITQGDWLVHTTLAVDETAGYVWFVGCGREGGDPYQGRLYRAPLKGGAPELLDDERAHHVVTPVNGGRHFVDVYSSMSDCGRSVLRDRSGRVVAQLQRPEFSGWSALDARAPERVELIAADGETKIWANIYLPPHLTPGALYPVLDDCYPGPQISRCPQSIGAGVGLFGFGDALALAALGFIVVQIDGRGTPGRSKAFQDHSYGAIERSSDLDDHEVAIRQLADQFPIDLERVGIFGASGGGYAAARAMLCKPDFYKAAVSACGNHDQRLLASIWGETFHGPPDEVDYVAQANQTHAANLKGNLLLIHGELDDTVTPSHSLRLVDALIEANADFEMVIVPNTGHGFIGRQGFLIRKRWDFFVRTLLGVAPPTGVRLEEPPLSAWL